jgi:hypothetical protein
VISDKIQIARSSSEWRKEIEMRRMRWPVSLCGVVLTIMILSGCEWQQSGSDDTWNDAVAWINFSGVYLPSATATYIVSAFDLVKTNAYSVFTPACDGKTLTFTAILPNLSIFLGSLKVTNHAETLYDLTGSGRLWGDRGGRGTVDYATGMLSVTFAEPPGPHDTITATYDYTDTANAGKQPGSSSPIYSLAVHQTGNQLTFTDNDGMEYVGKLSSLTDAFGTTPTNANVNVSTTLIGSFQVAGKNVLGNGVTMVGAFYADYTATSAAGGWSRTLANRLMKGTWIEDPDAAGNTRTGNLYGLAGGTGTIH